MDARSIILSFICDHLYSVVCPSGHLHHRQMSFMGHLSLKTKYCIQIFIGCNVFTLTKDLKTMKC